MAAVAIKSLYFFPAALLDASCGTWRAANGFRITSGRAEFYVALKRKVNVSACTVNARARASDISGAYALRETREIHTHAYAWHGTW